MILAESLRADHVRHGFFTRQGGNSSGIYASLNTGLGSRDDRDTVLKNRAHAAGVLGVAPEMLLTPYQHHSADVITVTKPWPTKDWPKADALVTGTAGILIAVNTADCTPVLFSDPDARVVGAAHAGWKGAIGGVTDATIASMVAGTSCPSTRSI